MGQEVGDALHDHDHHDNAGPNRGPTAGAVAACGGSCWTTLDVLKNAESLSQDEARDSSRARDRLVRDRSNSRLPSGTNLVLGCWALPLSNSVADTGGPPVRPGQPLRFELGGLAARRLSCRIIYELSWTCRGALPCLAWPRRCPCACCAGGTGAGSGALAMLSSEQWLVPFRTSNASSTGDVFARATARSAPR
jgi:hypothetical protein